MREERQRGQQRDHRQILKQQDGEALAAVAHGELFFFRQGLQHERSGRHGQSHACHQCRLPGPAQDEGNPAHGQAGGHHLCGTEAKYLPAQDPQARGLQFQPDNKEQQDDAELRDVQHGLNIVDQLQAPWADDHSRAEVSQYRAQSEPT